MRYKGGLGETSPPSPKWTAGNREVQAIVRDRKNLLLEKKAMTHRVMNPHQPAYEVLPDGCWKGEPCFIIGGGPSLTGFDFTRLEGKGRVIAVNKAFLDAPFADVVFFMDGSRTTFYGLVKSGKLAPGCLKAWQEFKGVRVFLNLVGRKYDDVYSVRSAGSVGLSKSLKKGLFHGNNSGVGALGLAYVLGANPIYLLGIDGKFTGGKSHYHGGYPAKHSESIYRSFAGQFMKAGKLLNRTKTKVYNLNPKSAVTCFPFKLMDEVLK